MTQLYVKQEDYLEVLSELVILKDTMRKAMNELGVPQPGYIAPVANAYNILNEALKNEN